MNKSDDDFNKKSGGRPFKNSAENLKFKNDPFVSQASSQFPPSGPLSQQPPSSRMENPNNRNLALMPGLGVLLIVFAAALLAYFTLLHKGTPFSNSALTTLVLVALVALPRAYRAYMVLRNPSPEGLLQFNRPPDRKFLFISIVFLFVVYVAMQWRQQQGLPFVPLIHANSDNVAAHKLYSSGQFQSAMDRYNVEITKDSHNPILYTSRGFCFAALKQDGNALADFNQAIKLADYSNEALVQAYDARAHFYYNTGQYQNAVADYTKALSIVPPTDGNLYRDRARAYKKLGQFDLAKNDTETADAPYKNTAK